MNTTLTGRYRSVKKKKVNRTECSRIDSLNEKLCEKIIAQRSYTWPQASSECERIFFSPVRVCFIHRYRILNWYILLVARFIFQI